MNNTTKSYPENNPLDEDVRAARKVLKAAQLRQSLYHYMRELADENGVHDVPASNAEEVARYTHRQVGRRSGFSPEECDHINGQLALAMKLSTEALPVLRY